MKSLIRSGVCGAWTFESYPNSEDGSGSCRLKSINACCGQFAKREVTATASVVSGYMCSKCWSTRNQCPCSFEDRRSSIDSNFIVAGGALKDLSPTVRAQILGGFWNFCFHFYCLSVDFCGDEEAVLLQTSRLPMEQTLETLAKSQCTEGRQPGICFLLITLALLSRLQIQIQTQESRFKNSL